MGAEAARITAAMGKYPLIMSGTGRIDAQLMEKYDRLFCKSGADGYYIVGDKKEGIGIAVKIDSGNGQARNGVVVEVLRQLGIISRKIWRNLPIPTHPKCATTSRKKWGACAPSSLCTRHNQSYMQKVRGHGAPDLFGKSTRPAKGRAGRKADHSGKIGRENFPRSRKVQKRKQFSIFIIPLFSVHYHCKLSVKITKKFAENRKNRTFGG